GVATFADLSVTHVGAGYTLQASATLSGTTLTATSNPFAISPAAAKRLVFTGQPSSTPAGAAITPAIQVTARDSFGNTATGFAGLAISGPTGGYTLTFTAANLAPLTSGTITLAAGAAVQLAFVTAPSDTARSGVALARQPVVQLEDGAGNPVSRAGTPVTAAI